MKKLQFKLLSITVLMFGLAAIASAQTTYWLGSRDGYELKFDVQVPPDAAAVIMYSKPAPGRGDDTKPRYRAFTQNVGGKAVTFHANEIGWETPKLKNGGGLTWAVNAGVGAEWRNCNTKDPLWNDFTDALAELASSSGGWSRASVVMAQSAGNDAPAGRLNLDGTSGTPSAGNLALWKLADINKKGSLSPDELTEVRELMLDVANAGRANPNYRREKGSQKDLNLPSGLTPLQLHDKLNIAAQNQAEYCAKVRESTHDQADPKYATLGKRLDLFVGPVANSAEAAGGGDLQDYPTGWMKSETHYRPWWNLDGQVVTHVGYGIAKSSDGKWYMVAVFGNFDGKGDGGGNTGGGGNENPPANNGAAAKEPVKSEVPEGLKFNHAKFFQTVNGAEKYATSFDKGGLDELQAELSFVNPSSQPFNVEARCYLNGKVISSEPLKDLKGTGEMGIRVAGEPGQMGKVAAGNYRFEVLLNGAVVLSAEATVK